MEWHLVKVSLVQQIYPALRDKKLWRVGMARWIAFLLTMFGAWLLTNTNINHFSLGWFISAVSTGMWTWFAYKDGDTPRALMELIFVILCIRGIINFY